MLKDEDPLMDGFMKEGAVHFLSHVTRVTGAWPSAVLGEVVAAL